MRGFGVATEFEIDDALRRLTRLGLLRETEGRFSVLPLPDALARLDRAWEHLLLPVAGVDEPARKSQA